MKAAVVLTGLVLWAGPLALALLAAVLPGADPATWAALLSHPQVPGGTLLAVWTGTAGLLAALAGALAITMALAGSRAWAHVPLACGAALAVPHLAFAIGFGFLAMPSGLAARILVGGEAPPDWVTVQDPIGLSLIVVLALKEMPFLMLLFWSVLSQGESARSLQGQMQAALSLGHGSRSTWLRVVLPQLLHRCRWPLVIVWAYGVTVVDLALVMGPTQPPTIGAVVWDALNDASPATNAMGAAGALAITVLLGVAAAVAVTGLRLLRPPFRRWLTSGPSQAATAGWPGSALSAGVIAIYLAVFASLILLSLTPRWPYPAILPDHWTLSAWQRFSWPALAESFWLALATSLTAVTLSISWFEVLRQRADRLVLALASLALGLPAILIAAGQYALALRLELTGTRLALFLVHLTPVLAYAFIVLAGPYRAFDNRLAAAARALGASPWRVWWQVKLPLLRAPVLTALAVGVSVSLVQFVPAQLLAAGRHATLPMEAVTLASGGNRALTAAAALALTVPALMAFALAGYLGRPRWR